MRVLVAAFAAGALSAPGQTFFVSLYVPHLERSLGLSSVAIATLYGAATLAGAACLPILGVLADRWSASRFLGAVVGALGLALALLASAPGPATLLAAWTALRCLGQGAIGVGILSAVSRAFVARRGQAVAIGTLGHPAGEFVFPAAIAVLLVHAGWRESLFIFSGLYLLLFAPAVAAALRGITAPRTRGSDTDRQPRTTGNLTELRPIVRSPLFWTATAVLTAAPVVVTALMFHQVAFFESAGLSSAHVPSALMYFAGAQVAAGLVAGRLIDRGALRWTLVLSCASLAAAPLVLAAPLADTGRVAFYGGALGLATGSATVAGGALWPMYFGVAVVGRVRAVTSGIRNAATAVAPLGVALLFPGVDLAGAGLVLVALSGASLLLALFLPSRRPRLIATSAEYGEAHRSCA